MPARKKVVKGGATRRRRATPAASDIQEFAIDPRVERQALLRTYERAPGAPRTRSLRIYTLDPSTSSRLGGTATVEVPYEDLDPGPTGALFRLVPEGGSFGATPLDLDDPFLILRDGLDPSPSDPRFHLQMAYAVSSLTYAAFRHALGREIVWAVDPDEDGRVRLSISPFGFRGRNAGYSREARSIAFGYFNAGKSPAGFVVPGGTIFTALSHDIIVHETTHALLDGLRSSFMTPSNLDVPGFHEGFSDIVALLMHFSHPGVVAQAVAEARGNLSQSRLLSDLAREFGYAKGSTDGARPLRSAIDVQEIQAFDSDIAPGASLPTQYHPEMEAHELGSVLASAVFEAFVTIVRRRTERLLGIAGIAPEKLGTTTLSHEMVTAIAEEASKVAGHFLNVCIRAIDYCPPVDMEIGEYLRAIITADSEVVPSDPWGYREALMRSFRRRAIFPDHVQFMTEDAVRWRSPGAPMRIPELAFSRLRFGRDPGYPASGRELRRQAEAIGRFVARPDVAKELHLIAPRAPHLRNVTQVGPLSIDSVRVARRQSPDGHILYDLVGEVTQTCTVTVKDEPFEFTGGCTLVIGSEGEVRYAIYKRLDGPQRQERQHAAIIGQLKGYWERKGKRLVPRADMLKHLHADKE